MVLERLRRRMPRSETRGFCVVAPIVVQCMPPGGSERSMGGKKVAPDWTSQNIYLKATSERAIEQMTKRSEVEELGKAYGNTGISLGSSGNVHAQRFGPQRCGIRGRRASNADKGGCIGFGVTTKTSMTRVRHTFRASLLRRLDLRLLRGADSELYNIDLSRSERAPICTSTKSYAIAAKC